VDAPSELFDNAPFNPSSIAASHCQEHSRHPLENPAMKKSMRSDRFYVLIQLSDAMRQLGMLVEDKLQDVMIHFTLYDEYPDMEAWATCMTMTPKGCHEREGGDLDAQSFGDMQYVALATSSNPRGDIQAVKLFGYAYMAGGVRR
jgi:hypothetical protein